MSSSSNSSALWAALLAVLIAVGGYFAWMKWGQENRKDATALLQANNLGVGHMEQFEYPSAAAAFEKVAAMDPSWLPGRINLGIALLNQQDDKSLKRATTLFDQVLKEDPDNPYAHFCKGLIFQFKGDSRAAIPHFEAVTRIDPNDAGGWNWLGRAYENLASQNEDDPSLAAQAREYLQRALKLDPYLRGAMYGLAMMLRREEGGMAKAKEMLDQHRALEEAHWYTLSDFKYTEAGRYCLVIGRPPERAAVKGSPLPLFLRDEQFKVRLAPGCRWASAGDFGQGPVADLQRAIRSRFGATLVILDYNQDGKPDLFLLGAVVEDGRLRDLLLRNDGGGQFSDATTEAGLAGALPSLGCCAADYDNDGRTDLVISGSGEQRLFRNLGNGKFEDVTAKAGLDKVTTVCLGATFVDLDQDSDLDLVLTQYAATAAEALATLTAAKPAGGAGLAVFFNVGGAPPVSPIAEAPPLETRFERAKGPALLGGATPITNVAVYDCDKDDDLDLVVFTEGAATELVLNDRLLRFQRAPLPEALLPVGKWNGALVLDADHDGHTDLLAVGPGQKPALLLARRQSGRADVAAWFEAGVTNSPALLQAQAIDLDLDGYTDVVGLSEQRKPVLLHNDGKRLVHALEVLGRDSDWPKDLVAVAVTDVRGQGVLDLLTWSEGTGLHLYANQGNGNHGLKLKLVGWRGMKGTNNLHRVNNDGLGTRVQSHAGDVWSMVENVTLSAGLGQSSQPLWLGLGRNTQADVVRCLWPDLTWQAEFNKSWQEIARIVQYNRKPGSCPVLFTWDGDRFVFVTDFLGAGAMGESLPGGGHRPPRPEESVKIEAGQLAPQDGGYQLKVSNPMDEIHYLDRLQLAVLDHPPDVRVFPDERFGGSGPPATQDLLAFRQEIFPVHARDHRGRDLTKTLQKFDRATADGFARRSWVGYAEEHWVELDFGERLAKIGPKERLILCLAGWTDYPFPDSIWAATQAGVSLQSPVLEKRTADGSWQVVVPDIGFPAGLPRLMTFEVTGKLSDLPCVLRLRTNMAVYWDQVFVAPLVDVVAADSGEATHFRRSFLEVQAADLAARGCVQEYTPDGRLPTLYEHDRLDSTPLARFSGSLTRLGDVTDLLRSPDDRFVIFGPGEEVSARFDASQLPELPAGWVRSFVLRAWGYSKDAAPLTAHNSTVEPLPFRKMSNYPYAPNERHPDEEYQRRYNTRRVGPGR